MKKGPWNSFVYASMWDAHGHAIPRGHGKHDATFLSVLLDDGYVPAIHDIVHGMEPSHEKETSWIDRSCGWMIVAVVPIHARMGIHGRIQDADWMSVLAPTPYVPAGQLHTHGMGCVDSCTRVLSGHEKFHGHCLHTTGFEWSLELNPCTCVPGGQSYTHGKVSAISMGPPGHPISSGHL